jgi:hypothetical protein
VIEPNRSTPYWVRTSILFGVGLFLIALTVSAIFIPQLRLLHSLQALIYVALIVLTKRNSPWGYGVGVVIATAWNSMSLFITHLFQVGVGQLLDLGRGGHVSRPDSLMVMVGGIGHFVLIFACMIGFLRLRPNERDWLQFSAGGFLALAYMALIIFVAAPR